MLTYTFSRREKLLLVLLGILLIAVVWYQLVFVGVQDQLTQIDSQIDDAESTLVIDTAKHDQMTRMQQAIDGYKAKGATTSVVPAYDNVQNVMAQLNVTLALTNSYSLSFDDLDTSQAGLVKRGVTLSFGSNSYDDAQTVIKALADGPYSCTVDSFGITDNTAAKTSSTSIVGSGTTSGSSSSFSVTAHLTYIESVS